MSGDREGQKPAVAISTKQPPTVNAITFPFRQAANKVVTTISLKGTDELISLEQDHELYICCRTLIITLYIFEFNVPIVTTAHSVVVLRKEKK